jgi:hypothetical protein
MRYRRGEWVLIVNRQTRGLITEVRRRKPGEVTYLVSSEGDAEYFEPGDLLPLGELESFAMATS